MTEKSLFIACALNLSNISASSRINCFSICMHDLHALVIGRKKVNVMSAPHANKLLSAVRDLHLTYMGF